MFLAFSFNQYLFFGLAYLIGSIPFGIIVAKISGLGDITKQGSGNIGATNLARVGGKKLGIITFLLDFLKAFIPLTIYINIFGKDDGVFISSILIVTGHILSVFNRFRGGKGVSSAFGSLLAINPMVFAITGLIWLSCFAITRISSASALLGFALLPFTFFALSSTASEMAFGIILSMIIYLRHIENIKRLLNGGEKAL